MNTMNAAKRFTNKKTTDCGNGRFMRVVGRTCDTKHSWNNITSMTGDKGLRD